MNGGERPRAAARGAPERVWLDGWPQGLQAQSRAAPPDRLGPHGGPTGICCWLSAGSQAHETQSGVPGPAMGSTRNLTAPRAPACHVHQARLNT